MNALPNAISKRGCYCDLWEKSPKTLEDQGIPRGFCGKCCVCGQSGHLRAFPGMVPLTDAWCDKHYRRTMLFHPKGAIGFFLWLAAMAFIVWVAFAVLK